MKKPAPWPLSVLFLLTLCFTLATCLQLRSEKWAAREQSDNLLKLLLGDARRLFANHFFVKADVYFHKRLVIRPIFDQAAKAAGGCAAHGGGPSRRARRGGGGARAGDGFSPGKSKATGLTSLAGIFIPPSIRIWTNRAKRGRYCRGCGCRRNSIRNTWRPTRWRPTGTCRSHLGARWRKPEQFLREGLQANPASYENPLLRWGQLYYLRTTMIQVRARNLAGRLALRHWRGAGIKTPQKPDLLVYREIVVNLARVEEEQGNLAQSLHYLEMLLKVSPATGTGPKADRRTQAEDRVAITMPAK